MSSSPPKYEWEANRRTPPHLGLPARERTAVLRNLPFALPAPPRSRSRSRSTEYLPNLPSPPPYVSPCKPTAWSPPPASPPPPPPRQPHPSPAPPPAHSDASPAPRSPSPRSPAPPQPALHQPPPDPPSSPQPSLRQRVLAQQRSRSASPTKVTIREPPKSPPSGGAASPRSMCSGVSSCGEGSNFLTTNVLPSAHESGEFTDVYPPGMNMNNCRHLVRKGSQTDRQAAWWAHGLRNGASSPFMSTRAPASLPTPSGGHQEFTDVYSRGTNLNRCRHLIGRGTQSDRQAAMWAHGLRSKSQEPVRRETSGTITRVAVSLPQQQQHSEGGSARDAVLRITVSAEDKWTSFPPQQWAVKVNEKVSALCKRCCLTEPVIPSMDKSFRGYVVTTSRGVEWRSESDKDCTVSALGVRNGDHVWVTTAWIGHRLKYPLNERQKANNDTLLQQRLAAILAEA